MIQVLDIGIDNIKGDDAQIKHDMRESRAIGFFSLEELDGIKLFPNLKALLTKILNQPQ